MITRVELHDGYSVVVENDPVDQSSQLGVSEWALMFTSKDDVQTFITLLHTALEFWEFDKHDT